MELDFKDYLFMVTSVLIVCTNVPLLYVFYKDSGLRSIKYLWIIGLCIVDLSTGVLAIPISYVVRAQLDSLGGSMMPACLFINGLGMITKQVAILGLLFITLDRFVAIRFPFLYHSHVTAGKVQVCIALMWALGMLIVQLPLLGWNNGWSSTVKCSKYHLYVFVLPSDYTVFLRYISAQIIPMVIIIVVYAYLFSIIRKHSRQIRSQESGHQEVEASKQEKQEFRAAKTFALYSVVFMACLFPLSVMGIVEKYKDVRKAPYPTIHSIATVLSYWVSVFNPMLYLYTNRSLQESFVKCYPFLKSCIRFSSYEGQTQAQASARENTVNSKGGDTKSTLVVASANNVVEAEKEKDGTAEANLEAGNSDNKDEENGKANGEPSALDDINDKATTDKVDKLTLEDIEKENDSQHSTVNEGAHSCEET